MDTKETKRKRPSEPKQSKRGAAVKNTRRKAEKPQNKRPPDSQIVYTQPKPISTGVFLLRLLTVVAVVLALTLGMSIFFKVSTVTVSGNDKYTAWDVREASGIQDGENLLTLNKARIGGKIKTTLPYVDDVRIGIKLPDTVNIEIIELAVTYAVEADDSTWWLMDASGKLLEQIGSAQATAYTQVLGVQVTGAQAGQQAAAVEPEPETLTQTNEAGETVEVTVPVTVRGAERLNAAISILQYLEDNGILGDAASVDVSDMSDLEVWYGDRYQVKLGDTTQLSYKIKSMKLAIDQMSDYQTGVLDASFTIWPDQVGYSSFEQE